ncbi:MAG: hypothetical protein ACE5E1_00440 [Phycisphaerae bacterium]
MANDLITLSPLGWVQVQLLGGVKRVLSICGLYAGAMLLFNVLIYRGIGGASQSGPTLAVFAAGSLVVVVFIEAALLFLLGTGAIKRAVHRDFTTDMITSHRTTAMTGYSAALGYLLGATCTVLALSVVNWLAASVLAALAGYPLIAPTVLFFVFGCLTSMIWAFALLIALSTRGATSIAGLIILLAFCLPQGVLSAHPGLSLLLGTTLLTNISVATTSGTVDPSIFISMIAQVVLAATFYIAAARKFARDDVSAFNPPLAYLLLAVCVLVSAVALRFWPGTPGPFSFRRSPFNWPVQCIVTLGSLALVAMLPVVAAARHSAGWARRKAKDPDCDTPAPRSFVEAPIIATVLVFAIVVAVNTRQVLGVFETNGAEPVRAALFIAAAFLLALMPVAGMFRYAYAAVPKAMWLMLLVFILWAVPPVLDLTLEAVYERPTGFPKSWVFGCSPIGTWILTLTRVQGPVLPGLCVQAAIGAASLLLARRARY